MGLRLYIFFTALCAVQFSTAQTPVPMAGQPGLVYTEDFSDIVNWTDGFSSGIGANRFAPVGVLSAGSIPSATKTTTSTATFSSLGVGGVQRGNSGIILLSTGTTDNTTAVAFDFLMNYSGVSAGTLSFDWTVIFNGAGARNSSLRVYSSTDGTTFTELTTADVLNFTNNIILSGSRTNIPLPASFTNSATARLRFYYHNGTGGATGARPKINIDNLVVTATGVACATPAAQPTALSFSNITASSVDGSFTASVPGADEYLVVASNNSTLTSGPSDGTTYNIGDGLGDGVVVSRGTATAFTATGLSALSHYYFFVFSVKSFCTGGAPLYLNNTPLINDVMTAQGLPDCIAPTGQPANLTLIASSPNIISGSFSASAGSGNLVIRSTSPTLTGTPVNGHNYISGESLGNGIVVESNSNTAFSAGGLTPNTAYYFFIFSFNAQNCLNGPAYNAITPLTGTIATPALQPCVTPGAQPTGLSLFPTNTSVFANFVNAAGADHYIVVQATGASLSANPVDNNDYVSGDNISGGKVVYSGAGGAGFLASGLTASTTYYYFIFSASKNCSGGTKYLTTSPLIGNTTTTNAPTSNVYFGNWHSHSDYSDGNKDNPAYTPADDYLYAMSSQCMDFLGISEHNHYTSNNNPGNKIANYHLGSVQANTFTSSHTGFVAMYGMEWGVIANGGHVVIYGDGMDQLFGWESGSGLWGPTNNYDVFVAKSDYTGAAGLFKTVNDRTLLNTFATLAHPNSSDFNNIAGTPYDPVADNAIAGSAVESGPAFSTNSTYTEPAPSMGFLPYFQTLLSKGYHLGPVIDHDNHNTTFGRTAHTRTAVIAPALSKTELTKAMYQMHFYATEDCDTKVDFSINAKPMGSIFADRFSPFISATLTDATTSLTGAVISVMYGVPGSGILPVKVYTTTGSTLSFTDNTLLNNGTGYYYLDIVNGSSRLITSPIWYTRVDNVLPVSLIAFTANKAGDRVQLRWETAQESNSKNFIVQHSVDGRTWSQIAVVTAAGYSSIPRAYTVFDLHPAPGLNYYRLQQNDNDGRVSYSDVRTINFDQPFVVTVYPNPANAVIHITYRNAGRPVSIQLVDGEGRVQRLLSVITETNILNVQGLADGLYFLKLSDQNTVSVVKVFIAQ